MSQLDLFDRHPRKANGKLTTEGLVNYLEDNQDKIKSGELSMKEMKSFTGGMDRGTIKKVATENGLAYKKEDDSKLFQVPISLCNVSWTRNNIKSLA